MKRLAVLLVLFLAACESDEPPAACGSIPQVTVNAGETATATACFTDPNGDVLAYSATSSNPGVATASTSGTNITIAAVAPGSASVTVTASDPGGLEGQQSFQVIVPNRPPIARGTISSIVVQVGQTESVDVSSYFTEPDGEQLVYGATSSNPEVATTSVAGGTVRVAAVAKGTTSITVTATDPGGLSAMQTFQSRVPNRSPEPTGTIPDQSVHVGETAAADLSPYFSDPDGDALTYKVASSNGAAVLVSVAGSVVSLEAIGKGTAVVTVTATDPEGLSAEQVFEVTVPNRAPEAWGAVAAQTVVVGDTAEVDMVSYFSDPDGDALTYAAASSNGAAVSVSVAGSVVSLEAIGKGIAVVTVTATDPEGLSAQQGFEVEVPNRAPEAWGAVAAQSVLVGDTSEVGMESHFSDPDGDALTYAAASSNGAVVSVSVAGSVVSLEAIGKGTAVVTVTATDPEGLSAQQAFEVTVPNRAPVARGAVAAQTVVVGDTAEVDMVSYFSDPDGDALTYAAASSNGAAVSVSVAGSVVSLEAIGKGIAVVTVTATDPEGLSAQQGFEVEVPNRAPEAWGAVAAQSVLVGDTSEVGMESHFSDPDGDALTYAAASSNGAVVSVSVAGSVVSLEAIGKGTAVVTVTATDPEGLSAQQAFEVTVPNRAPVARGAVAAQTVVVGDTAEVDMVSYFSDPDGDALTYAAASSNGAVVSVSAAGSVVSLEAVAKGTAVVTVTATDPEDLSAQQAFEVTVPSQAPVARGAVAAQTVVVGDTAEVDMVSYFSDPDGDALTYAAASSNGAVISVSVAGSVVSLEAVAKGTAAVTVTATDPEGLSAQQAFEVTVPNRAPVAKGEVAAQTVGVGDTAEVDMALYFVDPDGDPLSYAAAGSNGAAVLVSVAGSVVSLEAIARGTAAVTVTATDPEGLPAQQAFEVTVPNRAPVARGAVPAQTVLAGETASVEIVSYFSDPDGDALTYAVASSNGAAVSVSVAGTAVSLEGIAQGTAVVTVTATDPEGLSAQQAFEVDVRDPTVPTIVRVEPTVLVEGESATITGWGFAASPGDNGVFIGGLPAPVLSSTARRLSITVPRADCLPPREVVLRASTAAGSDSVTIGSTPISGEELNWPQFEWRHTSSGEGCMHLPGGGEFLIGVTSTSEDPSHLTSVTLAGTPGDASVLGAYEESAAPGAARVPYSKHPAPLISASGRVRPSPSVAGARFQEVGGGADAYRADWRAGHAEAMARNRALVEELGRPEWSADPSPGLSAQSSLSEGDIVTLNTGWGGPRVDAVVRLVGDRAVWLEDVANPAGTFTDAELDNLDTFYSDHAKPIHDEYFGGLSDMDRNGRVLVLMTIEINRRGYGGLVEACDLYPRSQCRFSNEAEIFYAFVPDPDGTVGRAFSKDLVLRRYPSLLTHEVTHIVQVAASVFGAAPKELKWPWETEGGAQVSQELVGHRLYGNASAQELGYAEWSAAQAGYWYDWLGGLFEFFSGRRSWTRERISGAPEECSWLTFKGRDGNDGPCDYDMMYGVSLLAIRFAMDRWGGQYPGGEEALLRRLTQSPLRGFASLVDVSPGWSIERILAEFYATLWLEGTAGLDTPGMTSWDIHDIVSRFDDSLWLEPYSSSSAAPSVSAHIRAGSSMYFHWTPGGPLRPTSFKVAPRGDGPVFVWAIRAR